MLEFTDTVLLSFVDPEIGSKKVLKLLHEYNILIEKMKVYIWKEVLVR